MSKFVEQAAENHSSKLEESGSHLLIDNEESIVFDEFEKEEDMSERIGQMRDYKVNPKFNNNRPFGAI